MSPLTRLERRRLMSTGTRRLKGKTGAQRAALVALNEALTSGRLTTVDVDCPVCGGAEFEDIASVDRQGLPVRTVRCISCPTLYSRSRFTNESLHAFYNVHYRSLYSGLSMPTPEWFESQKKTGRAILEEIRALPRFRAGFSGSRVLEIGTGAGGVLVPFREAGARVLGLDLDENFLDFGRTQGLDLRFGGVDNLDDLGKFDLVILKDVLEHLPNPSAALERIRAVLAEDGVVFIQVPGLQSLGPLGYLNDLLRYLQIAHLCHFTEESLVYLCERSGLRVVGSNRRVVVMCTRNEAFTGAHGLQPPDPQVATDALTHIYRSRISSRIRHEVRSLLPEPIRKLIRAITR